MITREHGYLKVKPPDHAPKESLTLEQSGACRLPSVFSEQEVLQLTEEIDQIYKNRQPDGRNPNRPDDIDQHFRYEMLNRSEACQKAVGHPRLLAVIEPLLGQDCHVIANTAWKNPANPNDPSQAWHIDAGPHIPLAEGVLWPKDIPHPIFAIGCHILLQACSLKDGPTGIIAGSHLSGRPPPGDKLFDIELSFNGQQVTPLTGQAGDVLLFVSDVWHRRLPTSSNDQGRFFLQVHYGRRDIQQRLHTAEQTNQLSQAAIKRAASRREKTLIGLHRPGFYDG